MRQTSAIRRGWDLGGALRAIVNAQFLKLQIASATESAIRHSGRMLKVYPGDSCVFLICVLSKSGRGVQRQLKLNQFGVAWLLSSLA